VAGIQFRNWSGEKRRCTWFDFEFDTDDASSKIPLECACGRSTRSAERNYQGIRKRNGTTGTFSYALGEAAGHYDNPMYELYAVPPGGQPMVVKTHLDCSIGGVEVFDMTFRLDFIP
jgi:hypothetical protein